MSKSRRTLDERGVGLIGTSLGTAVVMMFLFLAVHLMLALHTRSMVGVAAWDAARAISLDQTAGSASARTSLAQRKVDAVIGKLKPKVSVSQSGGSIRVTVTATSPGVFPGLTGLNSTRYVTRSALVRDERER
jgi:Flp pilus assembly protein TadG